jgi:hypothetical protein
MSEIYAPGSIAGPQGPAGPAGSAAAVSALAAAIMPSFVGRNLYDPSNAIDASQVNAADGTLTIGGQPSNLSPMMYCPGATSMVATGTINSGNWGGGICLYDANGNFMSALPGGSGTIASGTPFPLPGTQTYVRWGHVVAWDSIPDAAMMCYATITGTATLPGSYQPAGLDTVADVNAKDAVVAANAAASIAAAVTNVGTALGLFAQTVLPSPCGPNRNAFDPQKAVHNFSFNTSGVLTANSGWNSAMVFAPGATEFITNLPIRGSASSVGVCTFDSAGNFLAEISATTLAAAFGGNILNPNQVLALPGDQTYVGFSYNTGNYGWGPAVDGSYWAGSDSSAIFLAGTSASPCPASLPAGAVSFGTAGTHVKTASALGCPLDANGTGGGTDVTSLLNAFLATASAANPIKLILDGPCVVSGLVIAAAGYTTIEGIGQGSGLYVTGTAGSININGAGPGAYNVTPPARTATHISIRDFAISAAHGGTAAIFLSNCAGVDVENLLFTGANANDDFMLTIGNANRIAVRGCSFIFGGASHDGVHVDGLCEDITISDCYFATGDDAIALNAPEGYGGDISRVTVTNCIFDGSLTVMRIYSSLDPAAMPANNIHTVRNVVVSNCTGSVTSVCFNLGITNGGLSATTGADQIHDFTVSNCSFTAPQGLALLLTPIGSLNFRGVAFVPTGSAGLVNGYFSSVGELVFDDVRILRNGDGSSALDAFLYVYSGVALDRVTLVNCRAIDQEGASYTAHTSLIDCGGTITNLRLEAIDMTNIAALWGAGGTSGIASMAGHGVIATGVAVPDSVMGNNALYLSSNAGGAPSIKVGGTAKRFTLA